MRGICNAESKATPLQGPHFKAPSHDALTPIGLAECPNCHERKLPHRACPKCGYL